MLGNKVLVLLLLVLCGSSTLLYWSDTEDCRMVGDACPVWNDWYPKCHLGPIQCNGRQCVLRACTYCAAHIAGCSTDLRAGVNGIIHDAATDDGYHCAPWEGKGTSSFKVHCACGGGCSFHGSYRIFFTLFQDQAAQQ